MSLTAAERRVLARLIKAGEEIPVIWRSSHQVLDVEKALVVKNHTQLSSSRIWAIQFEP